MEFAYGPIDTPEPTGFEPLEWDDTEIEDDDTMAYLYDASEEDDEEDEFEDDGFGGWDDLKPFSSFDDESAWE